MTEARDLLNGHASRLHEPLGAAGFTPYQVIGHLTRLRQSNRTFADIKLVEPDRWSADAFRDRSLLLNELAERVNDIGVPAEHVWRGVDLLVIFPLEIDRLIDRINRIARQLDEMRASHAVLATILEVRPPEKFSELELLNTLAVRLEGAPNLVAEALGAAEWKTEAAVVRASLIAGAYYAEVSARLSPIFDEAASTTNVTAARAALAPLASTVSLEAFRRIDEAASLIPLLLEEARRLAIALGREDGPVTIREIGRLVMVGERVASSPDADPEAFVSDLWDNGVERGGDLALAVEVLEKARGDVGSGLSDTAWRIELGDSRRVLAAHGTSFMRIFSGEWRAANRLVRSVLLSPRTPLNDQLALLDALERGRAALDTVRSEDAFGRATFAADWRGERSTAPRLLALVDWMRSIRGLGAEPRVVAGKRPDRDHIGALSRRVSELTEGVRSLVGLLWGDLSASGQVVFGDAPSADLIDLGTARVALARLREAHHLYEQIAKYVDPVLDRRREALDSLAEKQSAAFKITAGGELNAVVFGPAWQGPNSNWPLLHAATDWVIDNLDIHQLASRIVDRADLARRTAAAICERDQFLTSLSMILTDLHAGSSAAIRADAAPDMLLQTLADRLVAWGGAGELLSKWIAYRSRAKKAAELGMAAIVDRLHDGSLAPDAALPQFETSFFEAVFAAQVDGNSEIAHFDGELHSRTVRSFIDLDRQRIKQSALEVVRAHHRRIPSPVGGAIGPLGILKSEIARRRGHMPIRQLMQRAALAVQALKPVFMMSPLSVAQFLPPGALTFDLLVTDEASQIQPVDALGAIARCRQVVVVGDPQQLPPTAFFSKMTGTDSEDDDSGAKMADIESILGLFTARGLPTRMLRWHYRSRHQSLIAVSNRQFYENKLFIVPSPYLAQAGMGLRFHHIENGIFESGTTRTNPNEAKAVAKAIVAHSIANPELSLGVVASSAAQRRAIQDQLELLRRALPLEHEAFFQAHPTEPFFIKNLENVQGDERDVIFISVGYGPTAVGQRPPMRFGPVGQDGGERRLNVLISRAKRRCDVFASMTDEDIDPDFANTRKGVFAFKLFMHFARTGRMTMAEASGRDHESVFEEQVAQALHERGYQVHRQIGVAGFFIDLAIADPQRADRYLLGIECDGAAYHSARSARDRDRLRQAVLEDHGWIIHRIWSTDWFRRPREQLDRVVAAIEAAKVELGAREEQAAHRARAVPLEIVSVDRGDVTEVGLMINEGAAIAPVVYIEAEPSKPEHIVCDLHEAPTGILTAMSEQVVAIEGPVHLDEIINRIRQAWGLKRAGSRIQEAVEKAVDVAVRQKRMDKDGQFFSLPGSKPVVRDRSATRSAALRKPEMLPPTELRAALVDIVARNFGATEDQIVLAVSRAVGFKATSPQLRSVVLCALQTTIDEEQIVKQDGLMVLGPAAPARIPPSEEPTPLERLIAEGEHEKLEFKQTLRWDVQLGSQNKKLEEVVVKTIAAFANREGGTLLIGVCDDGSVIGLEADYACLGGNRDKMELHLTNLFNKHFTQAFRAARIKVSFPSLGTTLCRIDVQRSRTPIYVAVSDRNGNIAERFFVRSGNSSQEIPPSQIASYVKEHFE